MEIKKSDFDYICNRKKNIPFNRNTERETKK